MLRPLQFGLLTVLGTLAMALAIANAVLFTHNRAEQFDINARQQYLQQTAGLEGLYRDIVRALAELAVKNNDQQVLQMLAAQGINVSVNPTPAAVPAAPAAPAPAAAAKR